MPCEMCGKEAGRTRRFLVERSVLRVCQDCEKFGTPLDVTPGQGLPVAPGNVGLALEKRRRQQTSQDLYSTQSMTQEMVADFAKRIKMGREKKGLTRQQLGGAVGEREVVIGRFEQGTLHPTDDVAKRLERELGIKLYETVHNAATPKQTARSLTLGDMLKDAMRKKEP